MRAHTAYVARSAWVLVHVDPIRMILLNKK